MNVQRPESLGSLSWGGAGGGRGDSEQESGAQGRPGSLGSDGGQRWGAVPPTWAATSHHSRAIDSQPLLWPSPPPGVA